MTSGLEVIVNDPPDSGVKHAEARMGEPAYKI